MLKKNKTVLWTVISALLLTMMPLTASFAAENEPELTVIGSTIKNDKEYFELSLKIDSKAVGFSTVGIVLQYASDVINPVSWDSEGTMVTMDETKDWQNMAAIPAVAPKEISGKTALAYQGENNIGYLYLSSESSLPLASLSESIHRTITVRFKYVGEDEEAKAASKQRIIDSFAEVVKLAPDNVAALSPAGQSVVYNTGVQDGDLYYTTLPIKTEGLTIGELMTEAPKFELEQDADSANTGGSDVSKFAALVFFDWDESTLLGSMVVDSAMPAEEIKSTINTFTQTLMPNDGSIDMTEWNDEKAKGITVYNPEFPLTSHNGYTFGKWIEYDSEAFTVYGEAVDVTDAYKIENIDTPKDPDYTNLSKGLVLKAAYIANTTINTTDILTVPELRCYTVDTDTDPNAGYITRFGSSDNYSVKVNVKRVNSNNTPIHRTRKTAVKAVFTLSDSSEICSLINLENVDEQIAEAAAPENAVSVTFTVIDIGGVNNWATGAADRSEIFAVKSIEYVVLGNVYALNELASTTTVIPERAYFNKAELNITRNNVYGTTSAVPAMLLSKAFANIQEGQRQKKNELGEERMYLSHDEMQNAISRGNYNDYGV